ncbi:MAG TPA: serine/threonine-protein kinase [Bryobacteraceae bacterium]
MVHHFAMVDILGRQVALSIGQTVGDYRVIGIIGAGGMGTVYKVQHLISDRIEAMKVILPDLIESPELADRFMREIKVQARLSHPNIAALLNALRIDNQLLMVMEYVDGATLHSQLRQGVLTTAAGTDIAIQVLNALAYAHAQGVVHRDIKPANIMFTSGGMAKLMDFGIARSLSDQHLTRTGAAVGSVHYMSPEQVRGGEIDGRSDLYSVGILLYEMITGVKPIDGESSWGVMNAHLTQIPRPPTVFNEQLPPALSLATLKALEKNPADRFQSALEFSEMLGTIRSRWQVSAGYVPARAAQARVEFKATEVATPSSGSKSVAADAVLFEPEGLDRVTRELAGYVGPVARVLVRRAAKNARNWRELYDTLAAEVPSGDERKRFLAGRRG